MELVIQQKYVIKFSKKTAYGSLEARKENRMEIDWDET